MIRTIRILILAVLLAGIYSQGLAKSRLPFAVTWAACQPYPYNSLVFDGIYQANLLSNLSLECSLSPYWSATAAFGNEVLKWKDNQWTINPVNQMMVSNVYLNTWHYMGGVKFSPWGEFIVDNFWRLSPYFTAEAGRLDLGAVDLTTQLYQYFAIVPMVGGGLGLEFGTPGEDEESQALQFFSRNVRFFFGLKYFAGFTPYSLQYLPFHFGVKIKF